MNLILSFLTGKPKALHNTSHEFLKQQDGYLKKRSIILNKHLDLPLTNKVNEESGVRDFTNDMDN